VLEISEFLIVVGNQKVGRQSGFGALHDISGSGCVTLCVTAFAVVLSPSVPCSGPRSIPVTDESTLVHAKAPQEFLRQAHVTTTVQLYAQSDMDSKRDAQGKFLEELVGIVWRQPFFPR
jgi:hypothetical protein